MTFLIGDARLHLNSKTWLSFSFFKAGYRGPPRAALRASEAQQCCGSAMAIETLANVLAPADVRGKLPSQRRALRRQRSEIAARLFELCEGIDRPYEDAHEYELARAPWAAAPC